MTTFVIISTVDVLEEIQRERERVELAVVGELSLITHL